MKYDVTSQRNLHFMTAAILIPVALFNLLLAWEYGITPAALGVLFAICGIYSLLVAFGKESPERKLPSRLRRVTQYYVILKVALYLIGIGVSLFMERAALDLEFALALIMLGALSIAVWGTASSQVRRNTTIHQHKVPARLLSPLDAGPPGHVGSRDYVCHPAGIEGWSHTGIWPNTPCMGHDCRTL